MGANIAEGCVKGTDADFARFLRIALGSASELQYHVLLARDLQFLAPEIHVTLNTALEEIKRMLTSFIRTLLAES
jgi:four helix bundle protein